MKEDFVPKEIAQKLKEKGFKEKCFGYYLPSGNAGLIYNPNHWRGGIFEDCLYSHNSLGEDVVGNDLIDAPTIEQTLKWLRDKKKVHVATGVTPKSSWRYIIMFCDERGLNEPTITEKNHQSYTSAIIAGIEFAINNLI